MKIFVETPLRRATRFALYFFLFATASPAFAGAEGARPDIALVEADANRSADTHLHVYPLPAEWEIDLYLKDESTHPTGSLKHRLARSLFLYGLCNGVIGPRTTVVEASSGSTAVSEAHFARMLGVPFVAVMASSTSPAKIQQSRVHGATVELVPGSRQATADEAGKDALSFQALASE